ncbi:heme NO-binding domain-containing protein [Sediminitomix flava]|uniref:Heme-NO-binding protein n=1 Tax=Sediminitomix flava TaxID=379075 RepID=A0A315ZAE2_SEDFL|nr:heme NO-binding domain-containing protein [Sediminitomix flava]PWJ42556.1 heme-NO-binding protein [Sediminitomix flava]
MKGIVFTEFIEMVEEKFGFDIADRVIQTSALPSNGVYTAVGTYSHAEMVSLLMNLSKEVGMEVDQLLRIFGRHLFEVFTKVYPHFFTGETNLFSFLTQIEIYIHREVQKLYPDAELPTFTSNYLDDGTFELVYFSDRRMSALAEGLITGASEFFNTEIDLKTEVFEDGSRVRFLIKMV